MINIKSLKNYVGIINENEFVDLEDDSVEILVDKKEILAQKA